MPRYLRNGKKIPNVRVEKAWIIIPVRPGKDTTPINTETYLVQTRVADYIEKLENLVQGDLPKLKI